MSPKRAARKAKFNAIERELSLDDVCWMARNGELLTPRPIPLDDDTLTSHLYGPAFRTVQLERIEVVELDDHGRVVWAS